MRRGSSSLLIIIGLFLLLAAGAAAALMVYNPSVVGQAQQLPPTAEPMVSVVAAEIDIKEGSIITSTEGLFKTTEVPMSQFSKDVNLSSVEETRNMIATTMLKAGEPVREDQLRKAGLAQKIPAPKAGEEPVKAFPLQVNSLSGVADLVQAGDSVDVLASFNLDMVTFTPGAPKDGANGAGVNSITERTSSEGTSKILLQDVQVLDVIKPAPPAEGDQKEGEQPAPEAAPQGEGSNDAPPPPATAANTLNSGNWIIVIGVTNQEAEVLRFALDRGIGITTILRRDGDHTTERTVGATMRILVDNYGMPLPSYPQVVQQPSAAEIPAVPQLPKVNGSSFAPTVTAKP